MRLRKPITASIVGTSFMTLFSYWYSRKEEEQFREPVLLARLVAGLKEMHNDPEEKRNKVSGWALHYLVGITFALSYEGMRKTGMLPKAPAKGILLGGLYGIAGITGWKTVFFLHPNPPRIDLKHYLAHLLLAHMVYGYFTFGRLEDDKALDKGK